MCCFFNECLVFFFLRFFDLKFETVSNVWDFLCFILSLENSFDNNILNLMQIKIADQMVKKCGYPSLIFISSTGSQNKGNY